MFITQNFQSRRKSLLSVLILFSLSFPLITLSSTQPAKAKSNFLNCISAMDVNICVEADVSSYHLYTRSGSLTSQKVSIGSATESSCPVFGAIDTPKGRVRVEGCLSNSRPIQLQGAIKLCNSGTCRTEPITLRFPSRKMLLDKTQLASQGYQLFLDGVFFGKIKNATRAEAIAHLELTKKTYPKRKIEGYFNGQKIGYELFWDGMRVGFEPGWNREAAISNLQWNQRTYPNKRVEGVLDGQKIGYELFWDGVRVGFEPGWKREAAIANLQWNYKTYPNKKIQGFFNGKNINLPTIPNRKKK
ncbi:hypothetical protein H6G14_20660 [Nostoc parmelioides FACHB-3921]|uniref:Uncharacterized protein n=2 Tax=Nostoc TaxID=1177 RepID=A0ABR8BL96_9NOSO|nr:hypothetical protein [Nostoc parmelioides FACHB-3921]